MSQVSNMSNQIGSFSASFGGATIKTSLTNPYGIERGFSCPMDQQYSDFGGGAVVTGSIAGEDVQDKNGNERIMEENVLMTSFLKKRAFSLTHLPFVVMCKTAAVLPRQIYLSVIPAAWQLLMDSNLQMSSSAGMMSNFLMGIVLVSGKITSKCFLSIVFVFSTIYIKFDS